VPTLQVTVALRARVTNGATSSGQNRIRRSQSTKIFFPRSHFCFSRRCARELALRSATSVLDPPEMSQEAVPRGDKNRG
jgi:hypothetical protein